MSDNDHYLRTELYELVERGPLVFDFLREGYLDGIWYWDLERRENEWMSPKFWKLLGYEPDTKQHLAAEWQDMIFAEDLPAVARNFNLHCEDPSHLYDQVVRYRHRDGSTVWVRCRGIAIRDETGRPIRMLGVHTDITEIKKVEEELRVAKSGLEFANTQLRLELEEVSTLA